MSELSLDSTTKEQLHALVDAAFQFNSDCVQVVGRDASMEQIALAYNSEITEFNGEEDHIHMLVRYPPTTVLSSLAGALKSKSASAVLDQFGAVNYGKHARTFWSSGFFLCSVGGATLEILKAYIENQGH
jgi:putative transposase